MAAAVELEVGDRARCAVRCSTLWTKLDVMLMWGVLNLRKPKHGKDKQTCLGR